MTDKIQDAVKYADKRVADAEKRAEEAEARADVRMWKLLACVV